MPYLLIIAVIIAIVAVMFALQNADPVTVSILFFKFEISLALVLLLTLAIGILLGIIVLSTRMFKMQRKVTSQRKEIEDLEDRLHKALERKTERAPSPPKPSGTTPGSKDASTENV